MAKYSNEELVGLLANDKNLDNDAKAQLIKILRENKTYGLVWEHNPEEAYELLRSKLPVFTEDKSKYIGSEDPSAPNHILIEGDNLHALHTLCFTHEGKFDLIYIDPPYNTGTKDWKYNNDYVDDKDAYRHSKWLTLMENRLKVAKKLLKPEDSCLIVTIDDNECLHIGCLLEQLFPNANMQMITTVISPGGRGKKKGTDFTRTEEYIFFLRFGECAVCPEVRVEESIALPWRGLIRGTLANGRGKHGVGACGPNQFYPIYVNNATRRIEKIGEPIMEGVDRFTVPQIEGCTAVFPVRQDGTEMNWGCVPDEAESKLKNGYLRVSGYYPNKPQQYNIQYLTKGTINDILSGKAIVDGHSADGSVTGYYPTGKPMLPTTVWNISSHYATQNGTELLKSIFGDSIFDYPKSLYAVRDCLRHILRKKKDALILDFFAGSGTTMHATMMLNQEDGGHRTCYLVTNNENNICEEVTYERNKRVIQGYTTPKGVQVEGLKGNTLRYFRTELLDRALTHQNKKALFASLVDTLRIKENCFTEQSTFGSVSLEGKDRFLRYFAEGDRKLLVVFDSKIIPLLVKEIEAMPLEDNSLKLYIFSDGSYPYTAEFEPVIDKIDLVAMPNAIISALKYVLPSQTDAVVDENTLTPDELAAELQAATEAENHEQN